MKVALQSGLIAGGIILVACLIVVLLGNNVPW